MDIYIVEPKNIFTTPESDMCSPERMADILGCDIETLNKLEKENKLFALESKRGLKAYPAWQFKARLIPSFDRVRTNWNGGDWSLLIFLKKSHTELNGRTAYEALFDGELDKVLSLVEATSWGLCA